MRDKQNELVPLPGFDWIDPLNKSRGAQWTPGTPHPKLEGLQASGIVDKWEAQPGYVVSEGQSSAHWQAELRHPRISNIRSGVAPGQWIADAGYAFADTSRLESIQWKPGSLHPAFENILAASQEGYWRAFPGFTFPDPTTLRVRWTPGIAHESHPNVIAADEENHWKPAAGFAFADNQPGNMNVVPIRGVAGGGASPMPSGMPTDEQMEAALGKVLLALTFQYFVPAQEGDSFFDSVGREFMRVGRDEAIQSALRDLFPQERQVVISGLSALVSQAVDGNLSMRGWLMEATRDTIVASIEEDYPGVRNADAVAEFLIRLRARTR